MAGVSLVEYTKNMKQKPKILILLDGNALIHRAYHALPSLTTKEGELVNAVYGFTLALLAVLEKFHPEYIAASFDVAGLTFRHEKFEQYKATRVKAPDDLYAQIPRVKEVVRAFNIPIYEKEGYEADDCVGTLAHQAEKENVETIIVTGDNDALQLVTPLIKVFSLRKGIKDLVLYDEKAVEAKYGFKPQQLVDYKGLCGDASDNIPGVKGIGQKTASDLLKKYKNLESVYRALDELKPAVRAKLEQEKETAFLSRELGTIDTRVPVTLNLQDALAKDYDRKKVTKLFQELTFFSLIKRLPGGDQGYTVDKGQQKKKEKKTKEKKIETKEEVEVFLKEHKNKEGALWAEKEEGSLFGDRLQFIQVAFSKEESVSVMWNEKTREAMKTFLEDEKMKKIVYDGKALMHLFKKEKIAFSGVIFDVLIAAYLLNSGGNVDFEYLTLAELGEENPISKATLLIALHEKYEKKLDRVSKEQTKNKTLRAVFEQIEMPLIPILFTMEENGILLNTKKFQTLSEQLGEEIVKLEKEIYTFAGREFNINSPKQLAEVLFVDLKISTQNIKKTKTGISTASSELEKLREYPIITNIESYRELFKLKTTYLDALPALVESDSRLHTTFQQAVAATGRLSSANPNLQNIPARNAWSEKIRGAFEAQPGFILIGVDYSQIELRTMAHLSGDKTLVEAFKKGEDIHRTTASVVFKVKPDMVTPDMRRQAKVFNFGIMYGMGAYGLSQAAQIDQKEAAKFIEAYFKKFSGVATYREIMKKSARTHHYIETEVGRRRYIPEIESTNVQVARGAERMAINMPIQGLAADIMKRAMLKVSELVREYDGDVRMTLQVHDELIFEVREGLAEEFAKKVKDVMEHAYPLRVPLVVEVAMGNNWGEI